MIAPFAHGRPGEDGDASPFSTAGWGKKITGLPTIAVGSVGLDTAFDPRAGVRAEAGRSGEAMFHQLAQRMDRGEFDLVAIGRSLLANPDWARIMEEAGPAGLAPYTREAVDTLY